MFAYFAAFHMMAKMNLPTLLLVDDDPEFISAQTAALSSHFHIFQADSVIASLDILQKKSVDCAMVDYYLNDGNGHDVARWIQQNMPWCPVVLVSAGLSKDIAVESFAHRIFDVLEKPYGIETVLKKLSSAVSEAQKRKLDSGPKVIPVAEYALDSEKRTIRYKDDLINLTLTEVKVLEILMAAKSRVVSREHLVKSIWKSMSVADNTLDTHLTNLRKKAPFLKNVIKGIRGVGYVFEP
ncbi:MAG: response regulator transcription factor [Proteobacteria bacterium]|nr:MAG: response regulator transcription factor [Pseudomonadota bacterium]